MAYILQKITSETMNGYMAVFRDLNTKRSFSACGNIPKLPNGVMMEVSFNGGYIKDFSVPKTERNKKLFEKNEIDWETFDKKVQYMKELDILWRDIKALDNPYDFMEFPKADRMFKALKKEANDEKRLIAIGKEIINYFRGQRMWEYGVLDYLEAHRKVEEVGAYDGFTTSEIMANLMSDERFLMQDGLKDKEVYDAQRFIINDIKSRSDIYAYSLCEPEEIEKYLKECEVTLSEEQKQAVWKLTTNEPTIITGGAGTGKTTTIKAIIDCYARYYKKENILLLAPTGKAARRITESIKHEYTAHTIHNGLRKSLDDDYIYYNSDRKLEQRLILVDESSMVDTLLMRDLLMAVDNGAKLFFIGDCNQLYPVGCGEPFFDFLQNDACSVVRLNRNFRQGEGTILTNAENILADRPMVSGEDFVITTIKKSEIINYVDEETQNISPYNELNDMINGHIHEKGMSESYRKKLKEYKDGDPRKSYYVGEKVIAGRNTEDYCNGDIGIVNDVTEKYIEVVFESIDGKDAIPVKIDRKHIKDISLANAITVHKMQGSECPTLRIFLPTKKTEFISKRMVYTAVTRAKKYIELYLYDEDEAEKASA